MILAQLELNEATEMDFGIEVHGTTESTSEIRFIIEGPTYGIICKCVENAGTITASIPKLKGILPAGTFNAKLEVVVDGKFFIPLSESIEFKPMVEFDITSTKAKPAELRIETKAIKVRVLEDDDEEATAEPADNEDDSEAEPENAETAAAPEAKPAAPKEDKPQGTKPEASWQDVVKASVTRPEKAPKAEVDPFYTKTPKVGSFVPASATKASASVTATTPEAPATEAAPASKEGTPARKSIDKDRAQALSSKLAEYKNKLAGLKGKK